MEQTLKTIMEAAEKHLHKIAEGIGRNGGDFTSPGQVDDALDLLKIHCKVKDMLKLV